MKHDATVFVSLSFKEISLPPFRDILILARKCPHGIRGLSQCMNALAPDDFDLIELEDPLVEAILVSKRILKRLPAEKIVEVLQQKVFPYITKGETVKVDFKVTLTYDKVEIDME